MGKSTIRMSADNKDLGQHDSVVAYLISHGYDEGKAENVFIEIPDKSEVPKPQAPQTAPPVKK
jgi:hypothetical protein